MQRGRLHVLGVRHHSPACARLVARTILRLQPAAVLIEGPADMNERLAELRLPHRLPIAVYSFVRAADDEDHDSSRRDDEASDNRDPTGQRVSTYAPFCQSLPEWQALGAAAAVGADARFMDLPAWDKAFRGVSNRYGDGARRHMAAVARLCARFHIDGYDALWDHLFEGALPAPGADDASIHNEVFESLQARLDVYFFALRNDELGDDRDGLRETFMRAHLRAALVATRADGRPVVAVCGGFHAPTLLAASDDADASDDETPPTAPRPPGAESYLVPWSFHRLDAFTGYAAGMPSPGYTHDLFMHGAAQARDLAMRAMVHELRAKKHATSAADLIGASTMTEGLARLRGHAVPLRTDLLDGVAAALVKEALEGPLPWTASGPVAAHTDGLLVQLLRVLSGDVVGRLATDTPLPPIVRDCEALLDARKLTPQPAPSRVVALRLHDEGERESSRLLHRLRVRGVPGFVRQSGPQPGVYSADASATGRHQRRGGAAAEHGERGLTERWTVADHADRLAALIEAAAFGATLEAAATAKLARALAAPDLNSEDAAGVVREAVLAGLLDVVGRALSSLRRIVAGESDLVRLGGALGSLLGLYDSDALFGARRHAELAAAVRELADRGLWLLEQVNGSSSATDGRRSAAVAALRDCARTPGLADDVHAPFVDLCQRRTHDADAPPALRGACLGALWSLNVEGAANNIRVAHAYVSNPYDFDVLFRMRPAGLGAALPLVADVTHRRLVSTGRADAWLTGGPNFQAPSVGSHFAGAGDTFFPNYTPQNAGQVTANRAWAFNTVSANFQVVAAANDSGILTALSTVRSNLNTGTLPSPTLQYFAVNQTTGVIGNANQLTQDADGFVTVPKAATGVGGSRTPTVILAVYFAAPNADSITLNLYPPGDTAADAPLLTNNIRGDAPVPATNRFLVAKTTTQLAFQEVIPLTLLNVSPANGQSLVHTCANRSDAAQCFWVKNFGELRNLKVRVPLRTAGAPTIFGTQATKAGSTVADYAATFPVKAPKSLPDSATTDYSLRESVAP